MVVTEGKPFLQWCATKESREKAAATVRSDPDTEQFVEGYGHNHQNLAAPSAFLKGTILAEYLHPDTPSPERAAVNWRRPQTAMLFLYTEMRGSILAHASRGAWALTSSVELTTGFPEI